MFESLISLISKMCADNVRQLGCEGCKCGCFWGFPITSGGKPASHNGMLAITTSRLAASVLCVTALTVTGCNKLATSQQPAHPEVKPAPQTPLADKKDELGVPSWDPVWNKVIEGALPPEILSSQVAKAVKPFCPRFTAISEEDRRGFWVYFFQALAAAEAGLVPTSNARHTEPEVAVKDTVTKKMVRSEGLLQLTYMDADRYGCDFNWDKDKELPEKDSRKTILLAQNNLICGIKILRSQLIDKLQKLATRASYWETLRAGTPGFRVFTKQMANVPVACRIPTRLGKGQKTAPNTAAQREPGGTQTVATK